MFGFLKDPRKKKLDRLLQLCTRGDDQVQVNLIRKLKSAALQFTSDFEGIANFQELKFALRPDQADAMAERAVELQGVIRKSPNFENDDELVFFLIEASLRQKAGHKWVEPRAAKLIDNMIGIAENVEV